MVEGRRIARNLDFSYMIAIAIILSIGLLLIYSAVGGLSGSDSHYFLKQTVWVSLGIIAFILSVGIEPALWVKYAKYIYIASILLLVAIFPLRYVGLAGSRWIYIGGIAIQPSEFAKLSVIFILTRIFTRKRPYSIKNLIVPTILVLIPALIILKQPDFGTATIFPFILFFMIFWAKAPAYIVILLITIPLSLAFALLGYIKFAIFVFATFIIFYIFTLSRVKAFLLSAVNLLVGASTPFLWHLLKDYQKERLMTFLNPKADPLGSGYNVIQSVIAVGSGRFWGKGFMQGSQSQLRFLPHQRTDFIFSLLSEEWGFVGAFILLLLFYFILYRIIIFAQKTTVEEYYLLIGGVFAFISYQLFVNVCMSLGLLPVTGLPLPLVSYGGSSMIVTMFALGLPMSAEFRRRWL